MDKTVGVIGAGSFGTAIANLLGHNVDVLMFGRKPEVVAEINRSREHMGVPLHHRIQATSDLQEVVERCTLLFPVVPSVNFREVLRQMAPFLKPYHLMIHATKGFDIQGISEEDLLLPGAQLSRDQVSTMSEVILQETVVLRVGCLSGPNLATEILQGQPTATVIASRFDEVIDAGQKVLSSAYFQVFGSHDLMGAELAGALKNVIAIGSGLLKGKGYGKNIQAMLITRGLMEMVRFGQAMGATAPAFFGTAGIGDLVATCTSKKSRNYTFGFRLGQGESVEEILGTMPELAEGVRTLKITQQLAKYYKLHVPITDMLYKVVFDKFPFEKAIDYLMTYPYDVDVDFLQMSPPDVKS